MCKNAVASAPFLPPAPPPLLLICAHLPTCSDHSLTFYAPPPPPCSPHYYSPSPPVVCSCLEQSSPILQELERNVAPKLANVMLICLEAECRQGGGAGLDSVSVRGEGRRH